MMKKTPLIHPRVFDDEKWAIGYAKHHAKMGINSVPSVGFETRRYKLIRF